MRKTRQMPILITLSAVMIAVLFLGTAFAQEEPSSRCGLVTLNDKPLTLAGTELKVGDQAPGFTLLDEESNVLEMQDLKDKILVISVMPSIDTPT